ncbi:hypothetical protein AOQ84DRAFT_298466 [Glonium stellatum]|uniref:Survival Motor Neuron Gemin2-binding domain-containing protein n=1 Tax=Glonium stellatum TaxID=574774 RepID=A0A8E2EVF3_9PEZI|nr:hypothetical protein AOQ84DRAFT_298466 [Glonium stellatum]
MSLGVDLGDRDAWDDSALIQSWEEALAEYKKYHSIHAKGQRIEDVLNEEELRELKEELGHIPKQNGDNDIEARPRPQDAEAGDVETGEGEALAEASGQRASDAQQTASRRQEPHGSAEAAAHPHSVAPGGSMPQLLLGSVQDENLKNLMMSWYYAGYYTGLYEGQQRASSGAQERS